MYTNLIYILNKAIIELFKTILNRSVKIQVFKKSPFPEQIKLSFKIQSKNQT